LLVYFFLDDWISSSFVLFHFHHQLAPPPHADVYYYGNGAYLTAQNGHTKSLIRKWYSRSHEFESIKKDTEGIAFMCASICTRNVSSGPIHK
jgi:hypothetical protein